MDIETRRGIVCNLRAENRPAGRGYRTSVATFQLHQSQFERLEYPVGHVSLEGWAALPEFRDGDEIMVAGKRAGREKFLVYAVKNMSTGEILSRGGISGIVFGFCIMVASIMFAVYAFQHLLGNLYKIYSTFILFLVVIFMGVGMISMEIDFMSARDIVSKVE